MGTLSVVVANHNAAMDLVVKNLGEVRAMVGKSVFGMGRREDKVQDLFVKLCSNPYDPTRGGTVSTWVGTWCRLMGTEAVRADRKDARESSGMGHEDRDGASFSQGFDRVLADHGRAYETDPDNLSAWEQFRMIRTAVRSKLGFRGLVVLRDWRKGIAAQDTARKLGVSNATVSIARNAIREAVRDMLETV